jgi:predicted nucleic acid-binding protein
MRVFFDSSAFAKRYLLEADSGFTLEWCDQATELALSVIAIPELIAAFCRLRRENKLSAQQYRQIKEEMLADIVDAMIIDTTPQVLHHATIALERHTLRGMDSIHIGAAIVCGAEVFITADIRQREAARAMGIAVVTP